METVTTIGALEMNYLHQLALRPGARLGQRSIDTSLCNICTTLLSAAERINQNFALSSEWSKRSEIGENCCRRWWRTSGGQVATTTTMAFLPQNIRQKGGSQRQEQSWYWLIDRSLVLPTLGTCCRYVTKNLHDHIIRIRFRRQEGG